MIQNVRVSRNLISKNTEGFWTKLEPELRGASRYPIEFWLKTFRIVCVGIPTQRLKKEPQNNPI